ncbi:FRG domain-containing protein [Bacillus thuringiensis]
MITETRQKIFTDEWNQILEEIAQFRRSSKGNWIWFRGHGSETYELDSGIFRLRKNKKRLRLGEYLARENALYNHFKSQSATFGNFSYWDLLFQMQHYGLKTRLLDWTDAFGTALYFAFNGWNYNEEENACIWLLDPVALNSKFQSGDIFGVDYFEEYYKDDSIQAIYRKFSEDPNKGITNNSFAMYPSKINNRLLLQNGFFTVQSNALLNLEEEAEQVCLEQKATILKKITLTPKLVECVYEYLTINNINHFTVFNDIEGLAYSLNKEFTEYGYDERLKKIAKYRVLRK